MKATWAVISAGLDQLFFSPLITEESAQDRASTVETFLSANGWTWDDVLAEQSKEDLDGTVRS